MNRFNDKERQVFLILGLIAEFSATLGLTGLPPQNRLYWVVAGLLAAGGLMAMRLRAEHDRHLVATGGQHGTRRRTLALWAIPVVVLGGIAQGIGLDAVDSALLLIGYLNVSGLAALWRRTPRAVDSPERT